MSIKLDLKDLDKQSIFDPSSRKVCLYLNNKWTVIDLKQTTPSLKDYILTATKIVSLDLSLVEDSHFIESYIQSFNYHWTALRLKYKNIAPVSKKYTGSILFNSYHKRYSWLSNFFSTLIFDQKHNLIYYALENGYVAFKARMSNKTSTELQQYAQNSDPKSVKQDGRGLWQRKTTGDRKLSRQEMARLVQLKFEQNTLLKGWLLSVSDAVSLQENTGDDFWGTANSHGGKNYLGKIISLYRQLILKSNTTLKRIKN